MAKKKPWWYRQDPEFETERRKYDQPLPSRKFISKYLRKQDGPMGYRELVDAFELIDEAQAEAFGFRLKAMVRDGELLRNRREGYAPIESVDLIRGRVVGHRDGHGFLVPDSGEDRLWLSANEMRRLFHGDRVVGHVRGTDRRGQPVGAVVEILERAVTEMVGRYFYESGVGFVVPEESRLIHDVVVPGKRAAEDGAVVVVLITAQPERRRQPIGEIREVLGDRQAAGMDVEVALRAFGIPHEWPDAVEAEAKAFGDAVDEADKRDREDLRDLPLVTIDGADARDFDDAVFAESVGTGWRVIVAIADVAHYVRPGSALDVEARERGTSVYFPEHVVPMLPEALSNGLCSLNPQVDRLCLACEMRINREGNVTKARFFDGVMRSAARLTYEQAAAMVVDHDDALRKQHVGQLSSLDALYAVYGRLRKAREKRGAIDFESQETRIVFGLERKIDRIEPVQRNDAHKLIEECMIAANVQAALFIERKKLAAMYRVHNGPDADGMDDLRRFLGELGLSLGGGVQPQPTDYARLIKQAAGRPDAPLIQAVLLRSLKQARYQPDNGGHFGLSLDAYAHFTSPIRRYPDLITHRAIRHAIHGGKQRDWPYSEERMLALGEHCSMAERRAEEATRDAVLWLKCLWMTEQVGEEFEGIVTGVTAFGLFVQLQGVFVDGLVHVTSLANDYYHHDPVRHCLTGERSGRAYRLADPIRVKLMRVELDERKIDLEPVGLAPVKGKRQRKKRNAR